MAGCCDSSGYRGAFNRKTADRDVRTFLGKGLDSTAGPMVDALTGIGLKGATVLEVGAGAGTALVTMLEAGADGAVGIDISPNYEKAAWSLLTARGHQEAVTWHTGDFVALADGVPRSDIVFLNRVVCCYPDMEAMVDAAGAKSNRLLALSFPRKRWFTRLGIRLINAWMWVHKNSFRVFVHDPDAIATRVSAAGFGEVASGKTASWHWEVWERKNDQRSSHAGDRRLESHD